MTAVNKELTECIKDIAEAVGIEIANDMVSYFPGTCIYIPKKIKQHHDIVKKLGQIKAEALVFKFAGTYLDIPMHLYDETKARKLLVLDLRKKNRSIRDIALSASCTERQVYSILEASQQNNPTLF